MKKQNGITLISLIITIIIMLILAGVALSMVTGDGSMLEQADLAVEETETAGEEERLRIAMQSYEVSKYQGNTETLADSLKHNDWCDDSTFYENTNVTTMSFADTGNEYTILEDKTIIKGNFSTIVETTDEFYTAISNAQSGDVIGIVGEINLTNSINASGKEITFAGVNEEACLSIPNNQINAVGATIIYKNLKFKATNEYYKGIAYATKEKFINCTIENSYWAWADIVEFENCNFVQTGTDDYNIWTYGAGSVLFTNCTFNCNGKGVLIYHESASVIQDVTFNGCKFNATAPVEGKAAIEIDSTASTYTVNINNCTSNGFGNGSVSGNNLWNNKKGTKTTLFVNGTQMLP